MKLYIGNKNPPFALDVGLDGSRLSFTARAIMQREFVGDAAKDHPNGAVTSGYLGNRFINGPWI